MLSSRNKVTFEAPSNESSVAAFCFFLDALTNVVTFYIIFEAHLPVNESNYTRTADFWTWYYYVREKRKGLVLM